MTRRRWAILTVSVCLLGSFLFLWTEHQLSRSFQDCVASERGHQSTNNPDKQRFMIGRFLARETICTVRLSDAHAGFIAAIAGVLVAWFTGVLWTATKRMSASADRQIADTRILQRAYLAVI